MKSKDQIKDEYAQSKNYDNWRQLFNERISYEEEDELEGDINNIIVLCSRDAWDRAVLAERKRIWDYMKAYRVDPGITHGTYFRADSLARATNKDAQKPEYEP